MKKLLLLGFMIIVFISYEKESHDHNHDHNDEHCCEIVQIQLHLYSSNYYKYR